MKKFGILFASALALLALAACSDEEDDITPVEQGDAYWAAQATVTSSDANFTATEDGGTIHFKTEGGSVSLNIDCGCGWIAENSATDLFATSLTASTLTVTADQNTVEEDLTGTITLMTENQRITFATIAVTQTAYGAPEITVSTNEWHAPAVGTETLLTEIAVDASADWTAESADEWLTVEKTGTGVSLAVAENGETEERVAKAVLTCTDGISSDSETITVTQDGKAYISLSEEVLEFAGDVASASVSVESNFDWDYTYDINNGWFTVTRVTYGFNVTVEENTDDVREGIITITAGDGAENVVEATLVITQDVSLEDAMIFTYSITATGASITLPLDGTINCTIDWGDGYFERMESSFPSHTYEEIGDFDVIIRGTVTSLYSKDIATSRSTNKTLTRIKQWGSTGLTSVEYAFEYYSNLESLPEVTGSAFREITSFNYTFAYCPALKTIPNDLFADCPDVLTFDRTFYESTSIEAIPAGLFDNCPKTEMIRGTFYDTAIRTVPAGLFDNCPEVTTYKWVFDTCKSLESIPDGLFDNGGKVTDFSYAFAICPSLKKIPDGLFDHCPEATTFSDLFYQCTSLEKIPTGLFDYCISATKFDYVFYQCSSLEEIPEGLFKNCAGVTTFKNAFDGLPLLESIPSGLFDSCTEVTTFELAFNGCASLKVIPDGLFNKCTEVTSFAQTFYGCSSLESIPTGLFDNCTKVTTFATIFRECSSLKEIPQKLFDNCPEVQYFNAAFRECSSLEMVPQGLFDNCPNVTNFQYTFYKCANLSSVPEDIFSKNLLVTIFSYTFQGCTKLSGESPYNLIDGKNVHLYDRLDYPDYFNVTKITSTKCFTDCENLTDYENIPSDWK